jgi:hypothetical protein
MASQKWRFFTFTVKTRWLQRAGALTSIVLRHFSVGRIKVQSGVEEHSGQLDTLT